MLFQPYKDSAIGFFNVDVQVGQSRNDRKKSGAYAQDDFSIPGGPQDQGSQQNEGR